MWKIGRLKVLRTKVVEPGELAHSEYVASQNLDLDLYYDISSISNWSHFGQYVGKDYKFIRRRIQELTPDDADLDGWNSLSQEEKYIVCRLKATNLTRVREILGNNMDQYMFRFDLDSQNCRIERFSMAKALLLNNVERIDAFFILQILESDKLSDKYIYQGIEGTLDTDPIEGLFNFVESTPLSHYNGQTQDPFGNNLGKYENSGILSRTLNFQSGAQISNNQDLVTSIMNCLREGEF
jgi:hypothetical protein